MVSPEPLTNSSESLKIVGIGASAGGLEAFTELVGNLPADAPVAYVLVQHLDPTHRSLLSELLGRSATLPVQEIEQNTRVERNRIYVIPPNSDLTIQDSVLRLTPREKNSGTPARSIDHFLKSLAADRGSLAIGVVLSGAGSDGAEGLRAIKESGGLTFAQDENSSKYDSMPRSAVATGCVDFVLPPAKIAAEIARVLSTPHRTRRRAAANARDRRGRVSRKSAGQAGPDSIAWPKAPEDANLRRIFLLLRTQTGIDFNLYRLSTIRRRIGRRMGLAKLKSLEAYHHLLRENPAEVEALYQDLLIGVTSFFRNPSVFDTLKKRIFPRLVKGLAPGETLRFWVAGCSTGQEAYSYAIAFLEFAEKRALHVPIQIFATDVNAKVLEQARAGRYTKAQLAGLSPSRVSRFFAREHDVYRAQKSLRDLVIFAQQNLLTDPPFTRVDLISCRNMLIYIEPALQQKIIPTFHYAIKPAGILVLGASESVGTFSHLFTTAEKTQKIYVKKQPVNWHRERPPLPATLRVSPPPASQRDAETAPPALDAYREADRLMMERYAPPAVLVNDDGEVLQFRGRIQGYLDLPSGKATLSLFKMARGSLGLALQKALKRARAENRPVRERVLSFDSPRQGVEIHVLPFRRLQNRCHLVVFDKLPPVTVPKPSGKMPKTARAEASRLAAMKRELGETRDHLEHLREQHETVVEELQASNEEVQSSNEELQSLNEELETSNEELESANEELTTLNEELATRNTELRESEQRLREQAQLVELAPLLARSPKDRIIFWNRGAELLYGFTRDEALGQTSHLLLRAVYPEPLEQIQSTLSRQGHWASEVIHRRKDGTELHIATRWVVHADEHNRLRAVLEVNTDVTARHLAEKSLRDSQELNHRILQSSPDCILVLDLAGRVLVLNEVAQKAAQDGSFPGAVGMHWTAVWAAHSRTEAESAHRGALAGESRRFQGIAAGESAPNRWWDVVLRPILDAAGHPERLLAVCRDVTERKQAELAALEETRLVALRANLAIEVARGGELGPILQQLAAMIRHHADAAYVRIWLLEGDAPVLKLQASAGLDPQPNQPQTSLQLGEGRVGAIATSKLSHVTHQVAADPDICDPEWARREGLMGFAGYPLVYESRVLGVLAVVARRQFETRVLRELALSAEAIALLIQRKQVEDERTRLLQHAMEARNAAVAASRAKDDFLATLSHELRTPLNPVLLLASDGADNPEMPAAIRATFETIRNNVSLEAKLIDDLLDLTRITHGKLSLDVKPAEINTLVADAVRIVSANMEKGLAEIDLRLTPRPTMVLGDPVRLQQVFWNILNNAVKFTPHGGTVTVTTRVADGRIRVEISDTGIGLIKSDLDRIFDPFSQVERRRGGLGLGLTISRQLLELHHGSIRATSDGPGKGSTFVVELPVLNPAEPNGHAPANRALADPPAVPPSVRSRRGRKLRLLLIEDHASTRTTLRSLLAKRGFTVTTADSSAEARQRFAEDNFDIIISDLGLPDGNGHELLREFRAVRPGLIGVALSGYGTDEDLNRSREAGYACHLTKPVSIEALDVVIEQVLATASPP
ncbi:MAG TPA: chemotaxis protein CheB [Lacunisphaera sp.]|nr:chemotaxis protein CheB [Lacunisphaera sp.]